MNPVHRRSNYGKPQCPVEPLGQANAGMRAERGQRSQRQVDSKRLCREAEREQQQHGRRCDQDRLEGMVPLCGRHIQCRVAVVHDVGAPANRAARVLRRIAVIRKDTYLSSALLADDLRHLVQLGELVLGKGLGWKQIQRPGRGVLENPLQDGRVVAEGLS